MPLEQPLFVQANCRVSCVKPDCTARHCDGWMYGGTLYFAQDAAFAAYERDKAAIRENQ